MVFLRLNLLIPNLRHLFDWSMIQNKFQPQLISYWVQISLGANIYQFLD